MRKLTKSKLKSIVKEEVDKIIKNPSCLSELNENLLLESEFTKKQRRELSRIIRNELASLFYDLYKKRGFWNK